MKLFICLLALVATVMSKSNEELLKASNERFTANMFQEIVKAKPGENIVLSAFSVLSPLAQLAVSSVGESHDEILNAIGLPNNDVTIEVFTAMTKEIRLVKGVQLNQANRVYVRNGRALNKQFAIVSKDAFNSDVKNIDFSKNVDAAREINTWVEDNTNHHIKDLVDPQSLDASTEAVLVNAIYFKGEWQKPFNKEATEDRDFHVSKNKVIKIPTMYKSDYFKYGESKELDAKLLELPYEGEQSSLIVVLPNQMDGINTLIEKLEDPSVIAKAVKNMKYDQVIVGLPKFKIETTTNLGAVLKKMKITKLFSSVEARLDNLLEGQSDLFISSAIQKAYIDVNEEGAEAGAANAFLVEGTSYNPDQKIFSIDRPFYFELKVNNRSTFNGIFRK